MPDATNWLNVVAIVQAEFCDGTLADECTWHTVFLIPKGIGDFRWIELINVFWKVVARLLNRQLTVAISFYDMLHRFRAGRGTGTASLKAKLLQQLTAIREAVLFEVFMDIWKAYDALYR